MDNNYEIFDYLKPQDNTKLSNLNGFDLLDLLDLINKYNLEYRNKLNTTNKASIGCEIEYENIKESILTPQKDIDVDIRPGWILREDGSLKNGGEVVSPIFYNNIYSWKNFKDFFQIFTDNQIIKDTCSAHVHIGANILNNKPRNWNNFLRLWMVYENIIFRFCYGEYLNGRSSIVTYSLPIRNKLFKYFKEMKKEYEDYYNESSIMPLKEHEFRRFFMTSRYYAVNFENIKNLSGFAEYNTIEFRLANGTLNPIIFQNLINLYLSLLSYSKSNLFDLDTIKSREVLIDKEDNMNTYNNINIDQALELCDLIFHKNIDKIYFLRQYLKDNEVSNHEGLVKAKRFTI